MLDTNKLVRFSLIDDNKLIYRGGQPTENHVQVLYDLGIKNIVNLRRELSIGKYYEKNMCKILDINYYTFPFYGIFGVDTQFINEIIDFLHNQSEPTYVHCLNGRDRTSLIVASYLVKYCDKNPNLAWEEDVLLYDHDENSMFYSQFKESFFKFCNELKL